MSSILVLQPSAFCVGLVIRRGPKHQVSPLSSWCLLWDVFRLTVGAWAAGCSRGTKSIWATAVKQPACPGSQGRPWGCASAGKHFRGGVALCHPSLAQTERRESA